MKNIRYLFILISFISCEEKKSTNRNLVPDKEVYTIINFIIENEFPISNSNNRYLSEEFPMILPDNEYFGIERMDKIFNKNDVEFMKLQMNKRFEFRIERTLIENKVVIPFDSLNKLYTDSEKPDKFWKRFEKKYGARKFDGISLPIFSVDYKTAIISYGYHCGSLCGSGETAIYRKVNGQWEKLTSLNRWTS